MKASEYVTATMTEEQLGEQVRATCETFGWRFLWLRKTFASSDGILDLLLIPQKHTDRRHILHRELKGYRANGQLGELSPAQALTIEEINAAGGDAGKWDPNDWPTRILHELK